MPLVGILALQGDFQAHARRLEQLGLRLAPQAGPAGSYRFVRHAAELDELDALILPGGESTAMLRLLGVGPFFEKLRATVSARPVFATCAGAILLAKTVTNPPQPTLGVLAVTAIRNAYGRQLESSVRPAQVAPEFAGELGGELEAVLIRGPQFADPGPEVKVVASVGTLPVLLLQGEIVAASFHPELSAAPSVHRWFLQRVARQ